ncbi:MAG: class I adenylate-forming enzyme family protein [Gloeotrichia echinulata DEX184]|nr:acyl--CoA ligase [Gloeotrichia echinulata DEX184]
MLFQTFRGIAHSHSNKVAIITTKGEQCTYHELLQEIEAQISGLWAAGIRPGEVVSTWLDNSVSYVSLLFALAALGAVHCPISRQASQELAAHRFATVRPLLLISPDGSRPSDNAPPTLSLQQLLEYQPKLEYARSPQTGIFRMQETSGSTGNPKLALWRQDKMLREIEHWISCAGISSNDIMFNIHTLDGGHAVDLHMFPALLCGGTLVLGDIKSPEKTLQAIAAYQATVFSALPQQYQMLVQAADATGINQLPALKLPLCGGGYLSDLIAQESYDRLGIVIKRIYGSTEFGMILANFDDTIQVGCGMYPVGDVEVRLEPLDSADPTLGEIIARSTHRGSGYFTSQGQAEDESEWHHTGDVAKQLGYQAFIPIGRLSDALTTAHGVMFAPQFEEILVAKVPLKQVVVLPGNPKATQDHTIVVAQPASKADQVQVSEELRRIMAECGVSGSLHLVDSISMTPTGKPDKPLLRSRFSTNL